MLETRRRYQAAGFAVLPYRLPAMVVGELCEALACWSTQVPPTPSGYGILRHNLWREVPTFQALLEEGTLAALAATLLDVPSVTLFQDNLIWKPPGTPTGVQWHQDYAYWPLHDHAGVTFWLALEAADADNGCLRYIPGTHREGERQPTNFTAPGAAPWRADLPPLDADARAPAEAVDAPLPAGGVLAHHPLLWHMSGPNAAPRHRRAWSLTWITGAARWDPEHAPHPYNYWLRPVPGAAVEGDLFLRFSRDGRRI